MNSADYASQGLTWSNNSQVHVWFNGTGFLWKPEFQWPKQTSMQEIQDDDPKIEQCQGSCNCLTWRYCWKIGISDLWLCKNEEGGSLDTKLQEDSYLKEKASTISLYI